MDQAMMLQVRERAYHIWAAHGGDAHNNWLQAETEILHLMTPQATTASAPKQKARGARNRKSAAATKVG
jgi:Protein of unknown function (DUF2934)